MNRKRSLVRLALIVGLCALAGAAAGIAGSAAAPSGKKGNTSRRAAVPRGFHHEHGAVHADAVVLNRAGNAFITETEDRGKVKSVSGHQLTITEGIANVTYKDVTLTIPSNATVVRNFAKAQLGDLKAGDAVHVSRSADGTFVFAADASHRPGEGHFGPRRGPRGPYGAGWPGPPGGPPPA